MKNYILILLSSILVISCSKPSPEIPSIHKRIITNNSSHSIKIKNLAFFEINIPKNQNFEKKTVSDGQSAPIVYGYLIPETDSIEIVFDDTLTVFHGSKNYTMSRDLRRNDVFYFTEQEIDGVDNYTYTYTFTDADYQEAQTK